MTTSEPSPRTRHFGLFYGVDDVPDDRPVWLVHGNCQAEALRVLLSGVEEAPFSTVRMPPVHELEPSDVAHLDRWLARASVVVSQPIRSGYRGLPLGTDEVARRTPARVLRWPVIRYAGLYPYQAIVRHPDDPSADPPVVPYHDLRTVAAARNNVPAAGAVLPDATGSDAELEVARRSVAELDRRERRDTDVAVSDVLAQMGADAAHTINHPGNSVLTMLAERILAALDVPGVVPHPGRTLLASVVSPLEPAVIEAHRLQVSPRPAWSVGGTEVTADHVHRTQLAWYAANPQVVDAALARHGDTMALLGL